MQYTDYIKNHFAKTELDSIRANKKPDLTNYIKQESKFNDEALKVYCFIAGLVLLTLLSV